MSNPEDQNPVEPVNTDPTEAVETGVTEANDATSKAAEKEFARLTRKNFILGTLLAGGGLFGFQKLITAPKVDGIASPFRTMLDLNARLWSTLSGKQGSAPTFPPVTGKARANGFIGIMTEAPNPAEYRLKIKTGLGASEQEVASLSLEDLNKLPQVTQTIDFKCVEGWSEHMTFSGIRFADLAASLTNLKDAYRYVGLETMDGEYYVSIDMLSMLHPQTLLATQINGAPLPDNHGAPLRLCIPLKYGIKNLKRVGVIRFSNERPPDYWHERGYDWYAGL